MIPSLFGNLFSGGATPPQYYNTTYYGTPTLAPSGFKLFGKDSLHLNTDTQSVVFNDISLIPLQDGTGGIAFWMYNLGGEIIITDSNPATYTYPNPNGTGILSWNSNGTLHFGQYNQSDQQLASVGAIPLNTWIYFEMSKVGSTFRWFIDGIKKYEGNLSPNFSSRNLQILGRNRYQYAGLGTEESYINDVVSLSVGECHTTDYTVPISALSIYNFNAMPNVDLIPLMTSNTTPEGIAFANTDRGGQSALWKAFNNYSQKIFYGDLHDVWACPNGYPSPLLGYVFSSGGKTIDSYSLAFTGDGGGSITVDFDIYTSSDTTTGADGTWNIIDTQTSIVHNNTVGQPIPVFYNVLGSPVTNVKGIKVVFTSYTGYFVEVGNFEINMQVV